MIERRRPSRGFSLIEVVIVMSIVAISLGLVGPRLGAGFGRIELSNSDRTVRSFIKMARLQANLSDRGHYVVVDRTNRSVTLMDFDLRRVRAETLPPSVEIVLEGEVAITALHVSPSGNVRGSPVRLRNRVGQIEVSFQ